MPAYRSPAEIRAAENAEQARSYLERAKKYADTANERYETGPGGRTGAAEMAAMNALVAIAVMQVPDEPATLLG